MNAPVLGAAYGWHVLADDERNFSLNAQPAELGDVADGRALLDAVA